MNHKQPGDTVIEVPGENGAATSKPFSECSVDAMRMAIRCKHRQSSSKPLPEAAVALADQYQEAVTRGHALESAAGLSRSHALIEGNIFQITKHQLFRSRRCRSQDVVHVLCDQ